MFEYICILSTRMIRHAFQTILSNEVPYEGSAVELTSHQGEFYGSMHCKDWNELFCDPKRMAESVLMEDMDSPRVRRLRTQLLTVGKRDVKTEA